MRALILGHFSTVGDIESLEVVQAILTSEQIPYDVLPYKRELVPAIQDSITISALDPSRYSHLIVVCGPIWPELLERKGIRLDRFAHCTRIGVNLTMVRPLEEWNPFHLLIERDSDRAARPDLTFAAPAATVPVLGLCTIARQVEYGDRQRHPQAIALLKSIIDQHDVAHIEVDTRWPRARNIGGLRSPAEILSIMRRLDMLLTNRLHGMVYALRAGVPVLAIDSVAGGDKLTAQAKVLGWPAVTTVEEASPEWIGQTFAWCLSAEGRDAARSVADAASRKLQPELDHLRHALTTPFEPLPVPAVQSRDPAGRRLISTFRRLRDR